MEKRPILLQKQLIFRLQPLICKSCVSQWLHSSWPLQATAPDQGLEKMDLWGSYKALRWGIWRGESASKNNKCQMSMYLKRSWWYVHMCTHTHIYIYIYTVYVQRLNILKTTPLIFANETSPWHLLLTCHNMSKLSTSKAHKSNPDFMASQLVNQMYPPRNQWLNKPWS